MKTLSNKIAFLILLMSFISYSAISAKGGEFSKTTNKEFKINTGALLNINTEFTDIKAINWDKDIISIEVIVSVDARNLNQAEDKFNNIKVKMEGNSDEVSLETELRSSFFGNKNNNIDIEVIIFYPQHISLKLVNEFGDCIFENIDGPIDINMAYGNFNAKDLLNHQLDIDVEFGKVEVNRFQAGDVEVAYGGFTAEIVGILNLDSEFSSCEIELVDQLELSSAYDKIYIRQLGSSNIESEFTSLRIEKLSKSLKLETAYGSFKLRDIAPDFEMIDIKSEFTSIKLIFKQNAAFAFEVEAEMSDFDFPKDLAHITYLEKEMFELSLKGYIGDTQGEAPKVILYLENANTVLEIGE